MSIDSPEQENAIPERQQALNVVPYPGRRPDLATLADVRREMARVYREMRLEKIATQDGTRLAFVLAQIGKLIQGSEVQARIDALETALGRRQRS